MIGSFLTRGLVMVFGYAYPAYECYKTVEKNRPEIEQLRFWCQYWILVAMLTVFERVGDAFVSWVPMYSEAKVAFFIYLWYPKTRGTTYVYDSFFKPYVSMHENEIDRNLLELRTRAGDMAILYWQKAASYGQTWVFDILQYVAAQSTPKPRPAQPRQAPKANQPAPAPGQQPENDEPPSPTSSTSSQQPMDAADVAVPQETAPPATGLNALIVSVATSIAKNAPLPKTIAITPESSTQPPTKDEDLQRVESTNGSAEIDEAIRVTRARLRKSKPEPKS